MYVMMNDALSSHNRLPNANNTCILRRHVGNYHTDNNYYYYGTISLSPVISKVFEYCFSIELQPLLNLNGTELQFGLRKELGFSDATFVLNRLVDFERGHVILDRIGCTEGIRQITLSK